MKLTESMLLRLLELKTAYYNGTPLVSDRAYDALEDQIRELDAEHPILSLVGAPPAAGWDPEKLLRQWQMKPKT